VVVSELGGELLLGLESFRKLCELVPHASNLRGEIGAFYSSGCETKIEIAGERAALATRFLETSSNELGELLERHV
jgi:hypothetical protein